MRSLSSDSGSVCGMRDSEAIALDYAAQSWAVKFMVKGTPERMEWIVASTSIKETNELLGNAASLAPYLSIEHSGLLEKIAELDSLGHPTGCPVPCYLVHCRIPSCTGSPRGIYAPLLH